MQVGFHKIITITYQMWANPTEGNTWLAEVADHTAPLSYLYGFSHLPFEFEQKLMHLQVGDHFDLTLNPQQAYGTYDLNAQRILPKETFLIGGEFDEEIVRVGHYLPLYDQNGKMFTAKVVAVNPDGVVMDFNHVLAGKPIRIQGRILHIREASPTEIAYSHAQTEGCPCC